MRVSGGTISVVSPSGTVIATFARFQTLSANLQVSGGHTLLIDGAITATEANSLTVRATLSQNETRDCTFGTARADAFAAPGAWQIHHFSLAADTRVALPGSTGFGMPAWELRGRGGAVGSAASLRGAAMPTTMNLRAGEYWLVTEGAQGGPAPTAFSDPERQV